MPSSKVRALQMQPSVDLDKLAALFASFPNRLYPVMKENVEESLNLLMNVMIKRSTEGPLYKRSGDLGRSWTTKPEGYNIQTYAAATGSWADYAVKHEVGGFYTPSRAKFFWIPVGPNIKIPSRKPKYSPTKARNMIAKGLWRYKGQKKTPGGPQGEPRQKTVVLNENNVPVYVLVTRVYIPPRLGFQNISQIFVRRAIERLQKAADANVREGFARLLGR